MIKLVIQSMTWILIIFISNTYAQYDLSTNEGKKKCAADTGCYICADKNTDKLLQCMYLPEFDKVLQVANPNKTSLVCPVKYSQMQCNKSEEYIKQEETIKLKIVGINNNTDNTDGNTYYLYGDPVISLSNNTVVTISQPYVNPYDTSIRDKYVFKKDYSSEIKDKLNDNWKIKEVNIIYSYNIPFNSKNYIIPNDSSDTVARQQYESLSGDTVNVYSLKDITLNIVLEKDVLLYDYTCPYDSNYPCYLENGKYFCSNMQCDSGNNIQIEEIPNEQGDPVIKPPKKDSIGDGGCVEDISKITIGEGTFGSCRLSSKTNALADNCCKLSINDRDKQEDIMTGVADVISVLGGTFSLISDFFAAIGWTDGDFIQVLLTDVMEFLKGGTCSNDEIAIATAAAATQGIIVNNNGITYNGNHDTGTCVYLGDYCSNYSGYCDKGSFLGIKWENPIGWGCERPAKAYCCFSSMFEKALSKAAREQMPDKYNWGTIRGQRVGPYNSKAGALYTPGNNPCKPDFKELNIDCGGVSVFDLVNINMDSEQFQTDMAAFTAITLKDITKEEGSYKQAQENMQQEIENLKNQSNHNSGAIINNTLDGIDINKFK